jgi:hypothetical protein
VEYYYDNNSPLGGYVLGRGPRDAVDDVRRDGAVAEDGIDGRGVGRLRVFDGV